MQTGIYHKVDAWLSLRKWTGSIKVCDSPAKRDKNNHCGCIIIKRSTTSFYNLVCWMFGMPGRYAIYKVFSDMNHRMGAIGRQESGREWDRAAND